MDFDIIDTFGNKRPTATDGDEVTLYVRPGGMKSVVVRYVTDITRAPDITLPLWQVRWDTSAPLIGGFTEIPVTADQTVDTGVVPNVVTNLPSVAAVMIDLTIPDNWMGVARCSVMAHILDAVKAVTIKFVILPFDSELDVSWMPGGLIDIGWELRTDAIWSVGLAERWGLAANTLISYGNIEAGGQLQFGIVPLKAGAPLVTVGDVTALSFTLRRAGHYDEAPLVTVSPAVSLVTVGSDKYYALTADLTSDELKAAFQDLQAQATANSALNIDPSKLDCVLQFTLTNAGNVFVSRNMPIIVKQPAVFP
jgi:hypothetical protein